MWDSMNDPLHRGLFGLDRHAETDNQVETTYVDVNGEPVVLLDGYARLRQR